MHLQKHQHQAIFSEKEFTLLTWLKKVSTIAELTDQTKLSFFSSKYSFTNLGSIGKTQYLKIDKPQRKRVDDSKQERLNKIRGRKGSSSLILCESQEHDSSKRKTKDIRKQRLGQSQRIHSLQHKPSKNKIHPTHEHERSVII